jgi:formylglycine-generating enzyme required for sulfatase activity/tRNA A-37 threonylcarbamoyl transferase component Bud32
MNPDRLVMSEAPLNHPGDEALRALSLGQLTEAELAHVSDHLTECPECCRRIDQLDTDDPLLARVQKGDASREKALVGPTQRSSAVRALRQAHEAKSATQKRDSEAAPVIVPAPKWVGDYDILAEVGRGGMGVVYKARHRGLNRLAALKMVLAGEFASATQELRFRREAELAARVRHPNIVQVYEIGSYEGRPFLAMEWVEGGSLANRLDGKPWPPGEAAALIETLARAIDVAHLEGIVHRDVKPANVLLSFSRDAQRSAGDDALPSASPSNEAIPKITDFGLAQPIEGGQTMTQSGFLVGTPGYMAPEQASGKRALVGPATDIYALGVVLYQLLTGQLPFRADSTLELLRAVTSDEPTRPRRLQPRLPRDLEAITLHCLEKEPARRYPTALALAEDLRRFQERKQVKARPVGAVARLARACRRRPLVALLLALLIVSLLRAPTGVFWNWREANAERDQPNAQARQADDRTESGGKTPKDLQQAAAKQLGIPAETINSIGMKLRFIPPGKFMMGSSKEEIDFWLRQRNDDFFKERVLSEGPQHEVEITHPFYMGRTEVTVGQFRQFVKTTGYQTQAEKEGGAWRPVLNGELDANTNWLNPGFTQTDAHPLVCVSWNDAEEFCNWLSKHEGKTYRLPTEAEWEYGCRAGSKGRWSFGDLSGELVDYARTDLNSGLHPWPVAGLKENAWGLHDMYGNVWEWCQDFYDANYYKTSPPKDPSGIDAGAAHIIRGGSFSIAPMYCRSALRYPAATGYRTNDIGFRIVLVVNSAATP